MATINANQKGIKEINLSIVPGASIFNATVFKTNGTSDRYPISPEALSSMFADRFCSGYLPVSQDGILYIEERSGDKVVAVQRGLRKDQTIKWDGTDHQLTTPWTIGLYYLTPKNGFYTRKKESLLVTNSPGLGPLTPLYESTFMGNTYSSTRTYRGTNICWGSTRIAPNGEVSVSSLVNILQDFYTQEFTSHLQRSLKPWEDFTKTERIKTAKVGNLADLIRRMWN